MTLARTPYARLSPADIGQVDRELKKLEQMSAGLYVPKVLVHARSPYTVQGTDTMLLCDCTAGAITLTFPLAARVDGMCVQVVKSDTSANAVTLSGTFSGVVNPQIIVPDDAITLLSMNGSYYVTGGVVYPVIAGETGVTNMLYPYGDVRRFGAKADDTTSLSTALSAALQSLNRTYGGSVFIPPGPYYVGTAVEIPHDFTTGAVVEIRGFGARLRTNQAISMIRRYPVNQADMNSMINAKARISGIRFVGDGVTANQKGVQLGATYGSVIDQCQFDSLDWGLDLQACLMAHVGSCLATNCLTHGFAARLGDWTGAGLNISECNHVRFQNCRNYASVGMPAAFYVFASNGVHLEDCITEGSDAVNNVLFDAGTSTTVKNFRCTNLHSENTPTGSIFRIKGASSVVVIDGVWQQTACVYVDDSGGIGTSTLDIRNIPNLPSSIGVWKTDSQFGKNWRFTNINTDIHDPTISTAWVGGIVPFGMHVDRSANTELADRFPTLGGYATLRQASGGVNYDEGTLAPLIEETGANDGFDVGQWTNSSSHKRWRRFIGMAIATAIRTITSGSTFVSLLTDDALLADTTAGNVFVNLPVASGVPTGREYSVKHVAGASNVQVQINGAGTIDGAATKVWCAINQAHTFRSDGTNWQVLSASALGDSLAGTAAGGTIPASTTQFLAPGSSVGAGATESARQIVAARAGTLRNLYVHTTGAQPVDAAIVFTVRKNGSNTGLTVTVAANAAAGTVSDTTHTAAYVAGDLISLSAANASASASATIGGFSVVLD